MSASQSAGGSAAEICCRTAPTAGVSARCCSTPAGERAGERDSPAGDSSIHPVPRRPSMTPSTTAGGSNVASAATRSSRSVAPLASDARTRTAAVDSRPTQSVFEGRVEQRARLLQPPSDRTPGRARIRCHLRHRPSSCSAKPGPVRMGRAFRVTTNCVRWPVQLLRECEHLCGGVRRRPDTRRTRPGQLSRPAFPSFPVGRAG